MRRRITIAMVLMVLAALVLSGLVSLAVATYTADNQTRHELVREATSLAATVQQQSDAKADPAVALRNTLITLRSALRLSGSAVVAVRPNHRLFDPAAPGQSPGLPSGVTAADLNPAALLRLQTVSGRQGNLLYAAVPYRAVIQLYGAPRQVVQVVVLSARAPSALASAGPWFLLSSVLILLLAGLLALRLGHRFVAPIRAAEQVARRIATGDLGARVQEPHGTDPELESLGRSINSMAEGLGAAKAAERHFLQSVSHDLRTPLTSIRGFAEAIEDGATADVVAAAGVIASEARRLERLVGDLLALATLEARRFRLQVGPVDLAQSAAAAAAGFLPAAADLGLTIAVDQAAADPPPVAMADPDRVAQIAANLIENALRYARTTVLVSVAGRGPGGPVELAVSDDGPGIPPEYLPRVFERLFGSRRTPDQGRPGRPIGSGLGLTIVAELAAAMGGSVRAESPLGPAGGTRIVVSLPPGRAARDPTLAAPGPYV